MARIRYRLRAFSEIRRLPKMREHLGALADAGAKAAGGEAKGYEARHNDSPTRARAAVIAATREAQRDNAEDHTLMGPAVDAMKRRH